MRADIFSGEITIDLLVHSKSNSLTVDFLQRKNSEETRIVHSGVHIWAYYDGTESLEFIKAFLS